MGELVIPEAWAVSTADYHANTEWIGHTMLEVSRDSLARYWWMFHEGGRREETDALVFGNAFDCLLLEPEAFEHRYTFEPRDWDRKGGRNTNDYKAYCAEMDAAGLTRLRHAEGLQLKAMAEAAYTHPVLGPMLQAPHASKQAVRWTDEETGLQLKCEFDYCRSSAGVLADIKTWRGEELTRSALARQCASFGYHRSEQHYSIGFQAVTGEWPRFYVFPFISKTPPYEVAVVQFDEDTKAQAFVQRREDYARLARAYETNNFREWDEVRTLELPSWALRLEDGDAE